MAEFVWVRVLLAVTMHAVILLVFAWDLFALATGHPELSVSALTQEWAKTNPVLPLATGLLLGHLFWPLH